MRGLLAKKVGMTRLFDNDGVLVPVTVLEIYDNQIIALKNEKKDGYTALKIGFKRVKKEKLSKPEQGLFKDSVFKDNCYRKICEFRIDEELLSEHKVGQSLDLQLFENMGKVDVSSKSKGKGFAGVVARYGFAGGRRSHGHRMGKSPGSIGMCTFPGRVIKGKKLPGHAGSKVVTVQNLAIAKIDKDKNLIMLKGPVPGARNSDVEIRWCVK